MPIDPEQVRDALHNAIAAALPGEVVNRWVCLVETFDENGERVVWWETSAGMKAWDSIGLLEFGIQREQAATIADYLREES